MSKPTTEMTKTEVVDAWERAKARARNAADKAKELAGSPMMNVALPAIGGLATPTVVGQITKFKKTGFEKPETPAGLVALLSGGILYFFGEKVPAAAKSGLAGLLGGAACYYDLAKDGKVQVAGLVQRNRGRAGGLVQVKRPQAGALLDNRDGPPIHDERQRPARDTLRAIRNL
jgi:hypothetical protein